MKATKTIFIAILLFGGFTCLHAQITFVKGYMINDKGDTLKGEIKMNPKKDFDLYAKVFFKDESGVKKNHKPDKVKGYGFENKHFVSAKYEGEMMFYKVLCNGKIMLYEMMYEMQQMNDIVHKSEYYIANNGDTEFAKLKQNKFKKQLSEYMKDNSELIENADDDKKFEIEKVTELINQYNDWAKNK